MIYESYLGGVLIHHGVKGMRWGVRRTPEQLGHVTNSAVANAEEAVLTRSALTVKASTEVSLIFIPMMTGSRYILCRAINGAM